VLISWLAVVKIFLMRERIPNEYQYFLWRFIKQFFLPSLLIFAAKIFNETFRAIANTVLLFQQQLTRELQNTPKKYLPNLLQ